MPARFGRLISIETDCQWLRALPLKKRVPFIVSPLFQPFAKAKGVHEGGIGIGLMPERFGQLISIQTDCQYLIA
jgi:hypothetical protein